MRKHIIIAAILGAFAAMLVFTPVVEATKGLVVRAANIAAKAVTVAKIQGGATGTVLTSVPDGGVAFAAQMSATVHAVDAGCTKGGYLVTIFDAGTGTVCNGNPGAQGPQGTVGTGVMTHPVCWLTSSTLGTCANAPAGDGGLCGCH